MNSTSIRKWKSMIISVLLGLAALLAAMPLFAILWYVIKRGLPGINATFFTSIPTPVGVPGGGMGNAIIGTIILVLLASVLSIPVGIGAGIYLSEFGKGRFAAAVRFISDVLSGVPSIVVGILVYALVVLAMGGFSAIAGGVALAIIMIPTLTRTTEQMMRLVPNSLREASLALGATPSQTIFKVIVPTASRGIMTGVMLSVARVMGESAPLLFTAFGSSFWSFRLDQPIAALPLQIFVYAISPYEDWQNQAWAGAFTLLAIVMIITIIARILTRERH